MGSKGSSTPQPAVNVPQAPTYGQQLSDYIANYPKLFNLEQTYGPQEAALQLDILKQYGPEYNQFLADQQQQLAPETYALQENLATLANQGMGAQLPDALKSQYQDQLRAELGTNAGSGIGADYVSRNLINLGEQYKQHYQDLGLSLLNRQPVQTATSNVPYSNPTSGINGMLTSNAQNYGSYTNALANVPYYTSSKTGGINGMLMGGLAGSMSGSPWGGTAGAAYGLMGGF